MARVAALLALSAAVVSASPYWDYVHHDDGAFAWRDTGKVLHSDSLLPENAWTGYLCVTTSCCAVAPPRCVAALPRCAAAPLRRRAASLRLPPHSDSLPRPAST